MKGYYMAITIRDVATLAGVSPSTVSRTCKDHSSISEETKIRVRRAMDQLGYEYNAPKDRRKPVVRSRERQVVP